MKARHQRVAPGAVLLAAVSFIGVVVMGYGYFGGHADVRTLGLIVTPTGSLWGILSTTICGHRLPRL
jgi:hypothetical protein